MKNSFYFSHDYNARTDEKIRALIRAHGMTGYGVFWAIVEDLYNNNNSIKADFEGIAFELRVETKIVENIVKNFDLFVIKREFIFSKAIKNRLKEVEEKSGKARKAAEIRWSGESERNANAMQTHSECNAIKKEKKEKKYNKETEIGAAPPSLSDVVFFFTSNGYLEEVAKKAFSTYEKLKWFDTMGNPIKDWKGKMQKVWFKDENKFHNSKMVY